MKKLTIIVPAFNEGKTIEEIITRIERAETPGYEKEIIVIDDGSQDGTEAILRKLSETPHFKLFRHNANYGKGSAIQTGLEAATGEFVIIQDADLEYDPSEYSAMLSALDGPKLAIYGSRNLGNTQRGYFLAFFGGKFLTGLTNLLYHSKLTDINTGYKLFETSHLKTLELKSNRFNFCEEVTVKLLKSGIRIKEIPISYSPRTFSEGKKVGIWDGIIGAWTIIKYKFKN